MKLGDEWFTSLAETEEGDQMIIVCGRDQIRTFTESGKFKERVEISWKYEADANGMPSEKEAELMERVQETVKNTMEKNKLAILTGIYTGGGERTWVFYTRNIPAFGKMFNDALLTYDLLPITIYTEKDPEWNEYKEMYELRAHGETTDNNENTLDV